LSVDSTKLMISATGMVKMPACPSSKAFRHSAYPSRYCGLSLEWPTTFMQLCSKVCLETGKCGKSVVKPEAARAFLTRTRERLT
jgi:hypothetical protein